MSRKSLKGRILVAAAAMVAIGAGGAAVALAASSTSGKTYAGCLTRSGTLTNVHVNPRHPLRCRHSKRITWNQIGPAGPPGAQGPQGAQGPAGASPTIAGTVMSDPGVSVPPASAATIRLDCPAGDIATGGGGGFPNPGGNLVVQDSEPIFTGTLPTGWQLIAVNNTSGTAIVNQFTLCLAAGAASGHIVQRRTQIHEAARVRVTSITR